MPAVLAMIPSEQPVPLTVVSQVKSGLINIGVGSVRNLTIQNQVVMATEYTTALATRMATAGTTLTSSSATVISNDAMLASYYDTSRLWGTTTSSYSLNSSTITGITSNTYCDYASTMYLTSEDLIKARLRQEIRNNLLVRINFSRTPLGAPASAQEETARLLLRDMLSEREWRGYCTNGFIMVRGESGRWYQLFSTNKRVRVYEANKLTAEICIHTDKCCPPSDHVVNLLRMVQIDEEYLWKFGNVSKQGGGSHFALAGNLTIDMGGTLSEKLAALRRQTQHMFALGGSLALAS